MTLSFKFGTVGSPANTPSRPGGTVGGIQYSASLGLDALELAWVHGVRISASACEASKRAAEETGLALSVHAPYFINLNGEEEKWPRLRQYLIDAAHFGNLAGATDIIFHPGTYFGKPADEVLKVILPRLQDCMDEIRADGNLVTLRPEISGKAAMLGSLADVLAMARSIPGVVPCMDFAHLHARLGQWADHVRKPDPRSGCVEIQGVMDGIERGTKQLKAAEQSKLVQEIEFQPHHLDGAVWSQRVNEVPLSAGFSSTNC
jgi:deoxyribonuclease-4